MYWTEEQKKKKKENEEVKRKESIRNQRIKVITIVIFDLNSNL